MGTSIRRRSQRWKFDAAKAARRNLTPSEDRLWQCLRQDQLGVRCRCQSVILGYIADFYVAKWKLVIEVDGSAHAGREAYDATRDAAMRRIGLRVMRFTNEQVMSDLDSVVAAIKAKAK